MLYRLPVLLFCLVAACDDDDPTKPPPMPDGADFTIRTPKIDDAVKRDGAGALTWRGGVSLQWRDPQAGGYSGLVVSLDGERLISVGRSGWLTGRIAYDEDGSLTGFEDRAQSPLLGEDGAPLTDPDAMDAEALALTSSGYLVGFETRNRIELYASPASAAAPFALPKVFIKDVPDWGGYSTVFTRADGRVVALTEGARDAQGVRGWIEDEGLFWLATGEDWLPVDAARLPDGDIVLIEVSRSDTGRFDRTRISLLAGEAIVGGATVAAAEVARLGPPLYWEKIEAVAARAGDDGSTLVYLMSDSRGSWPTDIMMFELSKAAD